MNKYPGKVMALDLGDTRIGIALSDATRTIAKAYQVIKRKSRAEDFARYQRIIDEQKVTLLVVGLPVRLDGTDSPQTAWVRDYTAELAANVSVPVALHDEALTTRAAESSLREMGIRGKKARQRVDAVAAALILQSFLDETAGKGASL
ncbi:MAG: Holliday junction resolvase RuvX [Candidatus Thermofonsia bacterium]|nr:MAG: Holliday junction resolvase RuvX [Candidatus Thermofonsia bacterium]